MNHNCQVLIMDEPSAVLTDKELDILFDVIQRLIDNGVTILLYLINLMKYSRFVRMLLFYEMESIFKRFRLQM